MNIEISYKCVEIKKMAHVYFGSLNCWFIHDDKEAAYKRDKTLEGRMSTPDA